MLFFESVDGVKKAGFEGFETIRTLMKANCSSVPDMMGVYLTLNLKRNPEFLEISVGGHFEGKNPTVPISVLKEKWVKNAIVVYIGKAGGKKFKTTLRKRLRLYMQYGQGKPAAHSGGRLIWQLRNHPDLLVCWKKLFDEEPRDVEKSLIKKFENKYERRPFANMKG